VTTNTNIDINVIGNTWEKVKDIY